MTRKFFCIFFLILIIAGTSYAQDDDSTPYMPYMTPQQIGTDQPSAQSNTPAPAPQKATTTRKTTTTRKKTTTATKKTPAPKQTTQKLSSLQQGIALMQQTKYEAARPYLLKAIQEEKNNPNAWYWYGVYHERTGGYHQAQYFYAKAVTIDPAFEPLSRIVFQPNDSDKTPLWDPKRPARVYELQASNTSGTQNSLGLSSFPTAPNDPETPRVPVYVPPDPGTSPLNGDAWAAGVYVPPSHNELGITEGNSAVYVPPSSGGIIATDSATYRQVMEIPLYSQPDNTTARASAQDDRIIRADLPLYTPPAPGEQKQVETPPTTTTRKSSVPASRVVRQTPAKKKTTTTTAKPATTTPAPKKTTPARTTTTTRRAVSQDTRPSTPSRTTQPAAPTRTTQPTTQPVTPARTIQPAPVRTVEPETENDTTSPRTEYMPPVGQYSPDPGTVSDTPIPPVGQGGD